MPMPFCHIVCPYCGQHFDVAVDPGGGAEQQLVVDCEICCRPLRLEIQREGSGAFTAWAKPEGHA